MHPHFIMEVVTPQMRGKAKRMAPLLHGTSEIGDD